MNRVASAVGEGAMSISLVHKYLEEVYITKNKIFDKDNMIGKSL